MNKDSKRYYEKSYYRGTVVPGGDYPLNDIYIYQDFSSVEVFLKNFCGEYGIGNDLNDKTAFELSCYLLNFGHLFINHLDGKYEVFIPDFLNENQCKFLKGLKDRRLNAEYTVYSVVDNQLQKIVTNDNDKLGKQIDGLILKYQLPNIEQKQYINTKQTD